MQLLDPTNYPSLSDLVSDAPHDLAVAAIAAGDASGRVYTDGARNPRFALVSPHWGRLYLLGAAGAQAASEAGRLLHEVIRPGARAAGARAFTLGYPAGWQPWASEVLGTMPAVEAERQYFRWMGEAVPLPSLPGRFAFRPADAILLADAHLQGLELLREEMGSERTSVDDFLARSFGVVAVHEDQLAGWCLSEYNTDGRCEVGIATLEPFQRQGLATSLGLAFVIMAKGHGIREVGWHCWARNVPSAATARKIGLDHVADCRVHLGWYDEADALR
jgi:hypothetical protein